MPQLTIRGISHEIVSDVSRILIPKLASIISQASEADSSLTVDDFTLDVLETKSYVNGHIVTTYPFIEVGWFRRSQEIQDQAAMEIDRCFKSAGIAQLEIVFTAFERNCYYADGEHY